jgi:hypothetical protein
MRRIETGALLAGAFAAGRAKYPHLSESWVWISHRIGGRLPDSLLSLSMQRDGETDLLIRCLEDEMVEHLKRPQEHSMFVGHYLNMLSSYWVGGFYESLRLLRERGLVEQTVEFSSAFKDFELVRIPLEKHEIAKDRALAEPFVLMRRPPKGDHTDTYTYDPKDSKRAHIMPMGLSARGSTMWHVIDLRENNSRWIERRSLSDRLIDLWKQN